MRWLVAVVLLAACEKTETPPPDPPDRLHGIELPEVAGPGYVAAKGDASIFITTGAIIVDGMPIVSLTNGEVGAEDKEGGSLGIKIPRLTTMGGKLAAKHVAPPLVLALDKNARYRLLIETLFSLKQKESGWKDFGVLANAKGTTVMVPISLPDKALPSSLTVPTGPEPVAEPVQLVVVVTLDKILVWSISGLEGTLAQPKATFTRSDPNAIAQVSTTLAEIAHRRWPSHRPDNSRNIIVMADGNTPIQTVAELFGAVRAAVDGSVLFPDILLSSSFE